MLEMVHCPWINRQSSVLWKVEQCPVFQHLALLFMYEKRVLMWGYSKRSPSFVDEENKNLKVFLPYLAFYNCVSIKLSFTILTNSEQFLILSIFSYWLLELKYLAILNVTTCFTSFYIVSFIVLSFLSIRPWFYNLHDIIKLKESIHSKIEGS